ncbi:MAG: CDP-glycerol glycerophosphotransferase family protein [Clostridiales bacterium]|nr:CDP-glycerol glycerophosphotransferase family protein [Clostridiales bacterium]
MVHYVSLYIDPGTGGMLFTVLFAIFGVVFFSARAAYDKIKFRISGGKQAKISKEKIPLVIFSDHKRYWTTFEPIVDELEKRQQKTIYFTCSEDDPALSKKYEHITCEYIGEGNKAFAKLNVLNASVVLSTTPSLDVFQWKRSQNVNCYIHIPHAASDITLYRMFGIDHYDAFILSGEYQEKQIRKLEELRDIKPRDIELCGIPYMDEMKKRLENQKSAPEQDQTDHEQPEHERTVLLAPSWGESGILSRFGEKLIDSLIATGYKVIVRPHPQSFTSEKALVDKLMEKYNDTSKITWNRDNDNFDVLNTSDILISDFSGVMFDYALVFDKPILYTKTEEFKKNPYDAFWIDEPLWTFEILPSLGLELNDENADHVKDLIDKCIEDSSFAEGREKARSETWVHIGEGASRSVDFIVKKLDEVKAQIAAEKEATAQAKAKKKKRSKKVKKAEAEASSEKPASASEEKEV